MAAADVGSFRFGDLVVGSLVVKDVDFGGTSEIPIFQSGVGNFFSCGWRVSSVLHPWSPVGANPLN